MRDKLLQIRVDDEFLSKLDYLKNVYGIKTVAECVRWIVEKEYRKEQSNGEKICPNCGGKITNDEAIEEKITPTEIIRCKDCKWFDKRNRIDCHNPRYGDGWANYPSPYVDEDYFCKDGKPEKSVD